MDACAHARRVKDVEPASTGCAQCLAVGDEWMHLRLCMTCGHVGCCDSSKNKHATAHAKESNHPIIQSFEPGENWFWCYPDERALVLTHVKQKSHADAC